MVKRVLCFTLLVGLLSLAQRVNACFQLLGGY